MAVRRRAPATRPRPRPGWVDAEHVAVRAPPVPRTIVVTHLRRRVNGVQAISPSERDLYSGGGDRTHADRRFRGTGRSSVMTADIAQGAGPRTLEDPLAE